MIYICDKTRVKGKWEAEIMKIIGSLKLYINQTYIISSHQNGIIFRFLSNSLVLFAADMKIGETVTSIFLRTNINQHEKSSQRGSFRKTESNM